jgi:hypothetical protein
MPHKLPNRNKKVTGRSVNSFISGESKRKLIEMIPRYDSKQKDLSGLVCSFIFRIVTTKEDMRQFSLLLGLCFTLLKAELKINS